MTDALRFTIIGENIHTTRVLLRTGRHVAASGDDEWLVFDDVDGVARRLPVPDWHKETQEHAAGRLKHVGIAIRTAMADGPAADDALAYLRVLAQRQVDAGAAYLDLNVDELSPRLSVQKEALRWLVGLVQGWTDVPIAIDSSHAEIIEEGLATARPGSRPMLNSASLERRSALDLAVAAGGPVVVTAAGSAGMPSDATGRVANASEMVDAALGKGIAIDDIFVDPLVFPVSVDGAFGRHALEAIGAIRAQFGPRIRITGGMSNASFGIPGRRLLNDAFLRLAIDAGADSGIIDPITTDLSHVMSIDLDDGAYAMARDAILGIDTDCRAFLRAYRAGDFAAYGVVPPRAEGQLMASVRVLSWKGIPAQVKARSGAGRPVSVVLPDWFGREIDRVAMREGLAGTDAYLAEWTWSDEIERPGDAADVARWVAEELAGIWDHPFTGWAGPEDGPAIK